MGYKYDIDKYCNEVLTGDKHGELLKKTVQRYLDDKKNFLDKGFYFDEQAATRAINFFKFLRHSKGQFAGKQFELSPWQKFAQWNIYGWKMSEYPRNQKFLDPRRFNYTYIEVARKNGKSTYMAGNALYLLDADKEAAAEIYCFATKEDQARDAIFKEAKNMINKSPSLKKRLHTMAKSIINEGTMSSMKPLGSDSDTQDGLNTSGAICDEYHAHKTAGMFNVIKSSMGARVQPLLHTITTAGFNKNGPCYQERDSCVKILNGVLKQENKFAMIFTLDKKDDWQDETNWDKANPSMAEIPTLKKYLRNEYIDSKPTPSKVTTFKTKNLNIWLGSGESFVEDSIWQQNNKGLNIKDLKGRKCYAGLDLASHMDLNALALFFPDKKPYDLYVIFWCPEDKVQEDSDLSNYTKWAIDGHIRTTPGNIMDIDTITRDILEILNIVDCKGMAFDPSRAFHGVIQNLQKEISNAETFLSPFRQGAMTMDLPTRELQKFAMARQLNHGGNPVLAWNNSNANIIRDHVGNIKLDKSDPKKKIDGMIAAVMAVGEYLTPDDESAFDDYVNDVLKNNKSFF